MITNRRISNYKRNIKNVLEFWKELEERMEEILNFLIDDVILEDCFNTDEYCHLNATMNAVINDFFGEILDNHILFCRGRRLTYDRYYGDTIWDACDFTLPKSYLTLNNNNIKKDFIKNYRNYFSF